MKIDPGVNLPWGSKYHMTPAYASCCCGDPIIYSSQEKHANLLV